MLLLLMTAFTLGNVLSAVAASFPLLVVARFASGLPHGAYFGISAVVAASLVPPDRRGRAVAGVMLGLTVANIVGVPFSTVVGQVLGWRELSRGAGACLLRGHGVGAVKGDVLQLGGLALLDKGHVVWKRPLQRASERPDYVAEVREAMCAVT